MRNRELKPDCKLKANKHYKLSGFLYKASRVFFASIWGALAVGFVGALVSVRILVVHANKTKDVGFEEYLKTPEYRQEIQMEISELHGDEEFYENIQTISSKEHARELYNKTKQADEKSVDYAKETENNILKAITAGISVMGSSLVFAGMWVGAEKLSDYEDRKGDKVKREDGSTHSFYEDDDDYYW